MLSALALLAGLTLPQEDSRPELGRVRWGRDLEAALTASKADSRPVMILFQEVPG